MPRGPDPFADGPAWDRSGGPGQSAATAGERGLPGLHDDERLPWLDAEDDADTSGADPARVWTIVLAVVALAIAGGGWWAMHRGDHAPLADGSLIAAPPGPIKETPQDPGGKTFDGTGDSAFAVSQGHIPGSSLAAGEDDRGGGAPAPVAASTGAPPDAAGAGSIAGAIGVQVGAFSTQAAAQAAWDRLAKDYEALAGTAHRIVEGQADIGTVYRLQAMAGSDGAAIALCARLKTAGLNCQVQD